MPENETPLDDPAVQPVDYAVWNVPGSALKVIYALPLFHEIDFVVNEGYRKIPHGGIEVGGVLYGAIDGDTVRLEAFRPIDCEHSSGPSLNFSERDLTELENQLTAPSSDRDLANFKPIGWFLAHTRGPMDLTETEARQFDRFFPQPAMLTVLVKPERFQPTRFGFLVRNADGVMPKEATSLAVILPLPGRSHKPGQLIPSIPAPAPATAKRVPNVSSRPKPSELEEDLPEEDVKEEPRPAKRLRKTAPPPPPLGIWKVPPEADAAEPEPKPDPEVVALPEEDLRTPAERAARKQLARDRARVMGEPYTPSGAPVQPSFRPASLPRLPSNAVRALPPPAFVPASESMPRESLLNPRSITALALAALLGCLVGYIGYLQLPAPIITLDVRATNQTIVVSWPPNETRNSIYAAIRFNDGAPVPLSAEEKAAGQVSLAAARDFKVEVMARNWARDSRGVIRYMHSGNANSQVLPSQTTP